MDEGIDATHPTVPRTHVPAQIPVQAPDDDAAHDPNGDRRSATVDAPRHERRQRKADERFRAILDKITDTVTVVSPRGRILYSTADQPGGGLHLGFGDRFEPVPLSALHPADLEDVASAWDRVAKEPGLVVEAEIRVRRESGSWADVSATAVNLVEDPTVGGIVITTRDVTALRQAERLAVSQAKVLELIARGADIDAVLQECVDLVESNGAGDHPAIHLDQDGADVLRAGSTPADPNRTWTQPIFRLGTDTPLGTLRIGHDDPSPPSGHRAQVTDVACSLVAIALDRLENETRLSQLALHDPLTGLPNRTLLLDRLEHALARRERPEAGGIAVLFCDLDNFKVVNDSLGHGVGDQLLTAFAERLIDTIDPGDTVARFGGDEFVVLLESVTDESQPSRVAERISQALEKPFLLDEGHELVISASIGLTMTSDSRTAADWLRDADSAMYRAKERGRNRLELFDATMRQDALERLELQRDLRRAVKRRQIVIFYQPLVDLRSGRITGVEALARWNHPERGLLGPDAFIPVAEDFGLIEELGYHIFDLALADAPALADACAADHFRMAVNVSAHQLNNPDLDRMVQELCQQHGWQTSNLLIEITESALTNEISGPADLLNRLQDMGMQLAIDDFGTGYSSLARLGQLIVDQVKLDRMFVASIDEPGNRLHLLVDAVVVIAERLGLEVVGEGVETPSQLAHLRSIGCDLGQGYLFAKPTCLDDMLQMLAADPVW